MGIPISCIIVSVQGMDDFLPVQNHWGDEDFALLEMYKFPACSHAWAIECNGSHPVASIGLSDFWNKCAA